MKAVVFYIETGNGFKSPAEAITRELVASGVDAHAVDFYPAIGVSFFYKSLRATWNFCLRHEWVFLPIFILSNSFLNHAETFWQIPLYGRKIKAYLRKENPDFVVSTHFISSALIMHFAPRSKPRPIPCFGYNSDVILSHQAYINKKMDGYFISTERGRDAMVRQGMPADRIHLSGFPIGPQYRKAFRSRSEERAALGLADMFTLLITFGGEGIGDWSLVRKMVSARLPIQVVAVCGKNAAMKEELERLGAADSPTKIVATGFARNLHEYLYCCDISAGKAGLNTAFEAMYLKRPFLALKAMANERYCAMFIVEQGYGWYPKSGDEALAIVTQAVAGSAEYARIVQRLQTPPCGFTLETMMDTMKSVSAGINGATLRNAKALLFDLTGTLCAIPAEDSWQRVNETGIRNAFAVIGASELYSKDELSGWITRFADEEKRRRSAAERDLMEHGIRSQILAFFDMLRRADARFAKLLSSRKLDLRAWDEIERAFMRPVLDTTVPFADARAVLEKLASRYPLYLLSNNVSRLLVDDILRKCSLEDLFAKVIVSSELGFRKPHSRFVAAVRRQTGCRPAECVMIGGQLTQDVEMANDFGMLSVQVDIAAHQDSDEGEGIRASARVTSLKDLPAVFGL